MELRLVDGDQSHPVATDAGEQALQWVMCSARLSGLALPSSFLIFFQLSPAARSIRRIAPRPTRRSQVVSTHCRSFFSVQPWQDNPWSTGSMAVTASTICRA